MVKQNINWFSSSVEVSRSLNKNYLVSSQSSEPENPTKDVIDSLSGKVRDRSYIYNCILIKYIEGKFLSPFSSDWLMEFYSCHILFPIFPENVHIFGDRKDQGNVSQFYFSFLMFCIDLNP